MARGLSSAVIEPESRPDLIGALATHATVNSLIFIPYWDRLTQLGLDQPNVVQALSRLAKHTESGTLVCSGYNFRRDFFTRPALQTAWRRHAKQRIGLSSPRGPSSRSIRAVPYRHKQGEEMVSGLLWFDVRTGQYLDDARHPRAITRSLPGHGDRVSVLSFS